MTLAPLIAVDIGNSRTKLGLFTGKSNESTGLPEPSELFAHGGTPDDDQRLADWIAQFATGDVSLVVSSVSRPRFAALEAMLSKALQIVQLDPEKLPIRVATKQPTKTGMDRLAAAVAADALRRPERAAIVIDLGTAITVDLLTAEGVFAGGAILPGLSLAARSLADGTDGLPLVALGSFEKTPDAVGVDTQTAIDSGLYWGTVGAIRELIERQSDRLAHAPQVYITGGSSPQFARLLGSPAYTVRFVPHLVLAGVVLASAFSATGESP